MARITVVKAQLTDALDQEDPESLDAQYPDGGYIFEVADETADPLFILMAREAEETYHA